MKNYIKGIITGAAVTAILCSIPSFAQRIDTVFNTIRINKNGIDAVQWGENYTLDNGAEVPYSIVYNDTTYVPLRKISGITGKSVWWNGDTQTAYITPNFSSDTKTTLTVQPDKNGNVWEYYTVEGDGMYLVVSDENRGYTRAYLAAYSGNNAAVWVKEDGIYFIRIMDDYSPYPIYPYLGTRAHLYKIDYLNDESSQDGEEIRLISMIGENNTLTDGDYVYHRAASIGNMRPMYFYAENFFTGESDVYVSSDESFRYMNGLTIESSTPDETVLKYYHHPFMGGDFPSSYYTIKINKNPLSVEKPVWHRGDEE